MLKKITLQLLFIDTVDLILDAAYEIVSAVHVEDW